MHYYILSVLLLISFSSVSAQNNSGEILYVDKVNLHKNLPPEREAFKDRIPEFRETKKILYFNSQEALYTTKPKSEAELKQQREFRGERRRGRSRYRGQANNNKYYTDLRQATSVDSRNFFGKDFLIEGSRTPLKWKITGDQKQVGVYLCQKAIYQDSSRSIVAWFTPMIPVSSGPDDFFGLPGMILHLDIDDGSRQITATEISLKELEEGAIQKPTKGKKISETEFNKIREEKIKEREKEFGSRGGRRGFRGG